MAYETLPKRLEEWAQEKVPGLREYLKREGLRDSDKLIRDELAKRLDRVRGVVDRAKKERVDAGSLKNLDKLDRATRKIEKVRDTIRFDSRGYRGIFDPEEVAERELLALLDFDQKLFGVIEELDQEAQKLAKMSDPELVSALSSFEDRVEAMDRTLAEREKYASDNLPA